MITCRAAPQGPGSKSRSIWARLLEDLIDLTPSQARQGPQRQFA